jgi:hypothetical protein
MREGAADVGLGLGEQPPLAAVDQMFDIVGEEVGQESPKRLSVLAYSFRRGLVVGGVAGHILKDSTPACDE